MVSQPIARRAALGLALAGALVLAAAGARAQADYPSRRVTLVVSASPGGGLDGTARLLAKRMAEAWNQPVIVENQGGADGLIATQRVAQAAPEGYTMLLQIPSLLLLKHNSKDIGFDPASALAPVSELGRTPSAVSVNARTPVKTIQELVAYCNRAQPSCSWGSGQQLSYLYGKRLFSVSGIRETVNVPYKGTGPVVNDLLGGHIVIGITSVAAPLPYHPGQVRILAVNAEKRHPQLPDVPTFREAGLNLPRAAPGMACSSRRRRRPRWWHASRRWCSRWPAMRPRVPRCARSAPSRCSVPAATSWPPCARRNSSSKA